METSKKKHNLKKPGSTKTSVKRQLIAATKKLNALRLVPDEILFSIFKRLSASDLLRCCCVSRHWNKVANLQVLWKDIFNKSPTKITRNYKELKESKQQVNWKNILIKCALERRCHLLRWIVGASSNRPTASITNHSTRNTVRLFITEKNHTKKLNKFLGDKHKVKWQIVIEKNCKAKIQSFVFDDCFVFQNALSVRWNSIHDLALSDVISIKLYALVSVFFNNAGEPLTNSVCTKALLSKQNINGKFRDLHCKISEVDNVTIFNLNEYLDIAIWNTTLSTDWTVAFIIMSTPLEDLLSKITEGSTDRIVSLPAHVPVPDDVDNKYGLHGYSCSLELRNARKSFTGDTPYYRDFKDGCFVDDRLVFSYERPVDYNFYDINEQFNFTWKSTAFKAVIPNALIMDVTLYDYNDHVMWTFSSLCIVKKISNESDSYSYDNCELWSTEFKDQNGECILGLIKNGETGQTTVQSIRFHLNKSFVNQWFATKY